MGWDGRTWFNQQKLGGFDCLLMIHGMCNNKVMGVKEQTIVGIVCFFKTNLIGSLDMFEKWYAPLLGHHRGGK